MNAITSTSQAADVADVINEAFPFSVDKFPLQGPDGMRTPHYGLFRSDNSYCVPVSVKKGYQPHTVEDIIAVAEAAVIGFESSDAAKIHCVWGRLGHKVIIGPAREHRRAIFGTRDNIFPRAIIDGRFGRGFKATFGTYRDACENLAMIRTEGSVSFNIRHSSGLRANIDEMVEQFKQLAAEMDNVHEIAMKMEERRASVADFIAELYPVVKDDSKRAVNSARSRAEKIVNRILRERRETGRPSGSPEEASVWELVNGVTGYIQHDKSRHGNLTVAERAIKGVEDPASATAWEHALQLVA